MKKKLTLTTKIVIALALGVITGVVLQNQQAFLRSYVAPFGTIFLNLIKTIVVPLVLFSIAQGIISLKDIKKVGAIGAETLAKELAIGVPTLNDIVAELVRPGRDVRDALPAPMLRTDVLDMKDLTEGMVLREPCAT